MLLWQLSLELIHIVIKRPLCFSTQLFIFYNFLSKIVDSKMKITEIKSAFAFLYVIEKKYLIGLGIKKLVNITLAINGMKQNIQTTVNRIVSRFQKKILSQIKISFNQQSTG